MNDNLGRTWQLRLPYTKPPLSMNDRYQHWAVEARLIKQVKHTAKFLAIRAGVPALPHAEVVLTYVPRNKARRDRVNLASTHKALVDGLVDAGVLADDTPEFCTELMPVIADPNPADPHLFLTITEVHR